MNYIDSIQITMDGMKETHDKLKPYMDGRGSFDVILNNVKLLEHHDVQELTLRINLDKNTLPSVYKFVDYLCDNGINNRCSDQYRQYRDETDICIDELQSLIQCEDAEYREDDEGESIEQPFRCLAL